MTAHVAIGDSGAPTGAPVRVPLGLGLSALVLVPLASFAVGTPALRYAFLALAFVLGFAWIGGAPRKYVLLVSFLFLFTPLARRVIDLNAGFVEPNPVMLTPYLVLFLALPHGLAFVLAGRRHAAELALMAAALIWGMTIGYMMSDPVDVTVDALKWAAPLLIFAYVAARVDDDMLDRMLPVLLGFGVAASLYAVVQYAAPPPWDALWVLSTPIGSGPLGILGEPLPFSLRVFGSLNSPGSLATALAFFTTLAIGLRSPLALPVAIVVFIAVPLTLQRSVMGSFAVAVILLSLLGGARLRARIVILLAGLALAAGLAVMLDTGSAGDIVERFDVTEGLRDDGSFEARMRQVENSGAWIEPAVLGGYGFEWSGRITTDPGTQTLQSSDTFVLDNGILQILMTFGAIAGTVYLGALASLTLCALVRGSRRGGVALGGACAAAGLLAQMPLGPVHAAELGFFAFLGLAIALRGPPRDEGVMA